MAMPTVLDGHKSVSSRAHSLVCVGETSHDALDDKDPAPAPVVANSILFAIVRSA